MENLQEIIKEFFEKIELEKIDTININYYFFKNIAKAKMVMIMLMAIYFTK